MKTTILPLLTALAVTTAAQAGSDYSAKAMPQAAAPSCLWSWFAGGSGGYLSGDWDEDIYTLHLGAERKCPGSDASHAIYLEVGYTEKNDSENFGLSSALSEKIISFGGRIDYDVEIIPITLNYKYEQSLTGNLNWYIGAGAGIALYDAEISGRFVKLVNGGSQDDTVFYAHIFAGLTYNVSEAFEIYGGVRYVYMDDPDFFTGAPIEDDQSPDGDLHLEIGARFNF
ncbi:hypothetical protein NT6N_29070 [Oceaniferula spumae]|uniref:Outer membrane protein beta-barrel domain-containing protein n=1 Tax=Oceaniferula spumae TaxID=2979115 RepID=A0AAT9FP32_9BACT